MTQRLFGSSKISVNTTLEQFLERPIKLVSGVLSTSDTATTFGNFRPLTDMCVNTMYANKLSGKFLVRADIKLRLQVNANKFQQGRYILAYVPNGGADQDNAEFLFFKAHRANLVHISQLHHVEIDLSSESEVTLSIPYNGVYQGFPISNSTVGVSYGEIGRVFIYPYSPLVAPTGSTTASYTLWANFENVVLDGVAAPQSGRSKREAKSQNVGPVELALDKVRMSTSILGEIPMLAPVMSPVSWASSILGRAAGVWGWSKPQNQAAVTTVTNHNLGFMSCTDVTDSSIPLSTMVRNEVTQANIGITQYDEMAIDYIKQIYAWVGTSPWTTSEAQNTVIMDFALCPSSFSKTYTEGGLTYTSDAPVTYLSRIFKYCRGGFKIKLKLVKTMMHSGRLMIMFSPISARSGGLVTETIDKSQWQLREVWDITEKNEIEVVVPFVSIVPWLRTNSSGGFGMFSVIVLDPLVAPSTVSSTVSLLVEVAGAPDYELAVPLQTFGDYNAPALTYSYQMDNRGIKNDVSDPICGIGGVDIKQQDTGPSEFCIGEKVVSLRALLKRYSVLGMLGPPAAGLDVSIRPFAINVAANIDATHYYATQKVDLYSYLGACYLYSRGGVRFRAFDNAKSSNWAAGISQATTLAQNAYNVSAAPASVLDMIAVCPNSQIYQDLYGCEAMVPQYHFLPARLNNCEVANASASVVPTIANGNASQTNLRIMSGQGSTTVALMRSIAEDGGFSGFISTMPLDNASWS